MALSSDLVSEFAKITNDGKDAKKEVTVYGTISIQNGVNYVKLDGSDELTPVVSTVGVSDGERVMVTIKQHQAVVTGNLSDPALGKDKIEFIVEDEIEGMRASLSITAEEITAKVEAASKSASDAEGYAKTCSEIKQTAESISTTVAGYKDEAASSATNAANSASSASSSASDAWDWAISASNSASNASSKYTQFVQDMDGFMFKDDEGTVWIDGGSVYTKDLHLGGILKVYTSVTSNTVGGYLGYDSGFSSDSGIGMRYSSAGPQCVCTNQAARLSYGTNAQVVCSSTNVNLDADNAIFFKIVGSNVAVVDYQSIRPYIDLGAYLGTSKARWISVWADTGTIQTSDRNKKNSIEDIPEKYITLFNNLKPRRFKMNNGTSDRYHIGYIAQEVEEAMAIAGIDSKEFAGLVKDTDEDGNEIYMLRYDEFESLYDLKIKQLEARYEAKISDLEERIAKLEARLG